MPYEAYEQKNFHESTLYLIAHARAICEEYMDAGYTLTLRQLYYQFVSRDLIPNKQSEYKRLGSAVNDGRMAGLIDWNAIEDRTRNPQSNSHWNSPRDILEAVAEQFATDKWANQPNRVEVWIEKEALAGVIEPVCQELDVTFFSCRGYTSQSEQWRAGKRFMRYEHDGQECFVLHLGDHDPSGIDMTRDNRERLWGFGSNITVKRLALNMDQITKYDPPPNPAKLTDSRAPEYVMRFGRESWELDALNPQVLSDLIRENVIALRDEDLWREAVEREDDMRARLLKTAEEWKD